MELIRIEPTEIKIAVGEQLQLKAVGVYSDSSEQDITSHVKWSASNLDIASVNKDGIVKAKQHGNLTIEAKSSDIDGHEVHSFAKMTALDNKKLNSIKISPQNIQIHNGLTQQLTATAFYSDGTSELITDSVIWSSSDTKFATINSNGLLTAKNIGNLTVTAKLNDKSDTVTVDVISPMVLSLKITPDSVFMIFGETKQFKAEATYSDGATGVDVTTKVSWTSDNPDIATIDDNGIATAKMSDHTTIIRAKIDNATASAALSVSPIPSQR